MIDEREARSGARGGVAGVGLAALAIACCAAWPVGIAVVGGISVSTTLGIGGGIVALVGAAIILLARRGRERQQDTDASTSLRSGTSERPGTTDGAPDPAPPGPTE